MLEISSAMQQDNIIGLVNTYDQDGLTFNFKEKKGIKLLFEIVSGDSETAVKAIKTAIKEQDWGSVLFFQVVSNR